MKNTVNLEHLKVHEQSITLYADVTFAMIPVTVYGQYNVDTNCFYPSSVIVKMALEDEGIEEDDTLGLEDFCEKMKWDYWRTYEELQEMVEKRDQ